MNRNKKDVDKHVENLLSKLSVKEFKTRAYSVARLYFDVGDYANCQKYVEQYLTQKDNNAAAYKLLGQAFQKLGQKEKALEQFKISLDVDSAQISTILDICELLADEEVNIEFGRAKYWCEKAEATFPRHPVTFRLRERLVTMSTPDPEALVKLLTAELAIRPKDPLLHARLIKHYLNINQLKEAFEHSCNVEFSEDAFRNNFAWYEILDELLTLNPQNTSDWLYQLLLLTVKERICMLSLAETPSGSSKSLVESNELLHAYDQALERVSKTGASPGFGEFHASLMQHHRGQFALHAATFLLKKAKKDQLSWRDAAKFAAPLMLIAWHAVPLDTKVNWLKHAPEKQQNAVNRWYLEGTFRCSQSGHYLISNFQDKNQSLLDQISQFCSGSHWRDKLYEKIFTSRAHLTKIKTSHLVSNQFSAPVLRLPRKVEVEGYDCDAQREYGNSLHHFVWILLNYKKYSHFKCTLFNMLTPTMTSCGPETLNKLDVQAFLYCAALTACQQRPEMSYLSSDKPKVLPAIITNLICPLSQLKWWDCAYKFSQNLLGTELTDIRATLSRGIEVVRCMDNHGLDPELLCILGRIFSDLAKLTTSVDDKTHFEARAGLYYASAIPLLEKLKSKMMVKVFDKRMFDYTHKELGTKGLISLIEESKLYVAVNHLNDCEYDKVIEVLSNIKSPRAYYYLSQTYKKIAAEENNSSGEITDAKLKYAALLSKAKSFAYKALDRLKDTETNTNDPFYLDIQELIEDLESLINKIDPDLSIANNDVDGKYSSDENVSYRSEHVPVRYSTNAFRNLSSTPKAPSNPNNTNYRTAIDTRVLENTRSDQPFLERIENEIKNLQKRDATITDFMEQTRDWFDENRKLGNQIISTIHSNIQNTTDQFKLLKISVDQVKDQIDECRNECKDVSDLKKQIAELKKEVNKLKKSSSEQNINESDLYNLDEEYRTNDNTSTFPTQLPFTPQVVPPFNHRLLQPFPVTPNPYQLYGPNLYNLYNQYSLFSQSTPVPGAPPIFDPARAQVNYPGVFPTPDQMYLDVAHLVPPTVPAAPTVPAVPVAPTLPTKPIAPPVSVALPVATNAASKNASKSNSLDAKETPRSLPAKVVITSSDPLPTCTTVPAPILSVTIPPKYIKGTPHNYQIPMPTVTETKVISPPVFSFPTAGNKASATSTPMSGWNQSITFKVTQSSTITTSDSSCSMSKIGDEMLDNSKTVVDGPFTGASPNTSLNKSRTLSERSNTSVENYDPCPDFKPIVPLPAEVEVTTGEENETVIFASRAKLFRFANKEWKERGLGEIKLLKHKITGKVRILMRREQIHKICANHIITHEMEIKPMKNESRAYFWVANDFADETIVLEKFCIRFKTADIALNFYNTFEKSRLESAVSKTDMSINEDHDSSKKTLKPTTTQAQDKTSQPIDTSGDKTVIGGFTFSTTPSFKSVQNETKSDTKPTEPGTAKVNVFSGWTVKPSTSSPFNNLFNTTPTSIASSNNTELNQETTSKLNTSDAVEEFEPNVEFKPVIPLPALIDQKTGEENETIIFENRAKLLRFDTSTKEWKERGLGNIKLLVHKDNIQKVRLLMRREQIMKVCCNHALTKEMTFQKMPNVDKAVTWGAKDFSEGELVAETFCLRFKTANQCDLFIEAIKSAQSKMKDDSKAAKEEQNAAKQSNLSGFGDKFKSKPGSWFCDTCYTNNLESFTKCACCEQPSPNSNINDTGTSNWGDKFKPKLGSWECQQCFIRNDANGEICVACNGPKDPSAIKANTKPVIDNTPKFNFGIPTQTADSVKMQEKDEPSITKLPIMSGWGDTFKPKEGTWECTQCFIRNEINMETCNACNNAKDPQVVKKDSNIFGSSTSGVKFRFGMPPTAVDEQKTETASIFDGTGAFSFGCPPNPPVTYPNVEILDVPKSVISAVFGINKTTSDNDVPVNFSLKKNDEPIMPISIKPALLPTPQTNTATIMASKDSGTFGFVFKPKTPPKGKSPSKSPKSQEDDSDVDESIEEDMFIPFNPVIPMPDKVDVVTGEENETELYGHRAKLYRFTSGEWKERGIGVVKVLKHNETGKLRVVMRREQVLKICLNHALTSEITYTPKDEKTWLFAANDFSEGELNLQQFCLRFKNEENALEFKDAIDKARQGKSVTVVTTATKNRDDKDLDDVVFVSETHATLEEKQRAKELMLPENFFTYINKEPCQGCRGCKEDDSETQESKIKISLKQPSILSTTVATPVKTSTPSYQSPTNSIYGTPGNMDKTIDNSIFRTPLGSIGSNTKSSTPTTNSSDFTQNDATNKENAFINKSNIFTSLGDQKSIFGTPQNKPGTLFGAGDSQTNSSAKGLILAPPKLSTLNVFSEKQIPESKTAFASTQSKPQFSEATSLFGAANLGSSSNKSIFDKSNNEKTNNQNTGTEYNMFGSYDSSVNLFRSAEPGSLFGPGSLNNNQSKPDSNIFSSQNKPFGSGQSFFGNTTNQASIWNTGPVTEQKKPDLQANVASDKKTEDLYTDAEPTKNEPLLSVDNNLSFAALSSVASDFSSQKKPDFQWEGAGQQLFNMAPKTSKDASDSQNVSGAGAGDEEYDPHYEPIVPLPDKIVVTTGEEDEEKMFCERCKLYRYDEKSRQWKERGVGEMKVLYHSERKTYRLLLRREQVHKAVLNMLIFMELELLPMKNSDRAWTWAGRNFAETVEGEQETLAVRFKSIELANVFHDKVVECVRKLQAAAAQAIREEKEASEQFGSVAPLRLPKHLQASARADNVIPAKAVEEVKPSAAPSGDPGLLTQVKTEMKPNGELKKEPSPSDTFKQVHFQEPEEGHNDDEEEEDYEHDSDAYYNEYDDESAAYYSCEGEAIIQQGQTESKCSDAYVQVLYDKEIYSPKILVTDTTTGEILADMLVHTDTEFQLKGDSCKWSGTDYTSNDPVDKTVTINFYDSDTAVQFYDSCEASKVST